MSSVFIQELWDFSGATISNACVPTKGKGKQYCDGKSTVFYNGCCRRRGGKCGANGYLGQKKGWDPRTGVCIAVGGGTASQCPLDCVGDKWQGTGKCNSCTSADHARNRKRLGIKAGESNLKPGNSACVSVCKKECGALDAPCNSAKNQCSCGGTHPADPRNVVEAGSKVLEWCKQIPPGGDFWCDSKRQMLGAVVAAGILVLFLLKR